ncbi:hypothetical protein C8R43DRAFT_945678 [Mycena crocata]|nr:hypothetical protein C8R43DRAFT_945678 [Mycena crocata]
MGDWRLFFLSAFLSLTAVVWLRRSYIRVRHWCASLVDPSDTRIQAYQQSPHLDCGATIQGAFDTYSMLQTSYKRDTDSTRVNLQVDITIDILDELNCAFEETLDLEGTGRNQGYLKLMVQYAIDVVIRAQMINLLPSALQPVLGPRLSPRNRSIHQGIEHSAPLIEHRLTQAENFGPDWPGKPNDLISWLLELAEGDARSVPQIILRLLATNLVAIHTTSMVLITPLRFVSRWPDILFRS